MVLIPLFALQLGGVSCTKAQDQERATSISRNYRSQHRTGHGTQSELERARAGCESHRPGPDSDKAVDSTSLAHCVTMAPSTLACQWCTQSSPLTLGRA